MARPRRIIRKLQLTRVLDIEDQLWPIVATLLVLAGCVAGVILAKFSFRETNPLLNAGTWLGTLALTCGALMYGAVHFQGRKLRRTLLISLLTILVHLIVCVVAHFWIGIDVTYLFTKAVPHRTEQSEPTRLDDNHQIEAPRPVPQQEFERPVETQTPEVEEREILKPQIEQTQPKIAEKPIELETPKREINKVQPIKLPETQPTAPRPSETLAKLSRQPNESQPSPVRADPVPKITTPASSAPAELLAQVTPTPQRTSPRQRTIKTSDPQVATEALQPTPRATRRESTDPQVPQSASAMPVTRQKLSTPSNVPDAAATANVPRTAPPRAPAAETQPRSEVARRESSSPRISPQPSPTEPSPDPAPTVAKTEPTRQQSGEPRPALAQSPAARPTRTPSVVEVPATQSIAQATPAASVSPQATLTLDSNPQQAARSTNARPSPPRIVTPPSDVPSTVPQPALAAGSTRRQTRPVSAPAIAQTATSNSPRARAPRTATRAASPLAAASTPLQSSSNPTAEEIPPSRMSADRSVSGIAGAGRSENLGRSLPAANQPAPRASMASAQRATSQQLSTVTGLVPSRPAQISQRRAGADLPSATLRVTQVAMDPNAPGSHQPSDLNLSASAASERNDTAAPAGKITAAQGEGQIDTGPVRTVAKAQQNRAAGGGQLTPTTGTPTPLPARDRPGGAPASSVQSEQLAQVPVATERGTGGGKSASPADVSPATVVVGRAATGAASVAPPAPAAKTGPPASTVGAGVAATLTSTGRVTAVESTPGLKPGGGTARPTRLAASSAATRVLSERIELAGVPSSDGGPSAGDPQAALAANIDAGTTRTESGAPGGSATKEPGSVSGDTPQAGPALAAVGLGTTRREDAGSAQQAPEIALALGGAPLRKLSRGGLPDAQAQPVDVPEIAGAGPVAGSADDDPMMGLDPSSVSRQLSGGVRVVAKAEMDDGGLGMETAPDPGILGDRATRNSTLLTPVAARIITKKAGAEYSPDLRARGVQPAFAGRRRGDRPGADNFRGRPSAETEEAIEAGLVFLARVQNPDGCWSLHTFKPGYEAAGVGTVNSDTAGTGLALLAFLGAGYDHFDHQYEKTVGDALEFLMANQLANGDLYIDRDKFADQPARFYSHAIAALALCEAYGMTSDTKLREPAQRALDYLVKTQHSERGGWRYNLTASGHSKGSDTSVTGWVLMALKSGELAGLDVPEHVYEKVEVLLASAQAPGDPSRYVYNPHADRTDVKQRKHYKPSVTMTSVALLMRMYLGWNRDEANMQQGADHLLENLPAYGTPRNNKRDTYYWYYATQVMFHMGGERWKTWNDRLQPLLQRTQIQQGKYAGSWNPNDPLPDAWSKHGGRIYVTAMNLLSLEVYYRHLPIYEETGK